MAGIVLNVEKREKLGTGGARATRKQGLIPGVLYGGARGSIPIEMHAKEVETAIRSGKFLSHMIEIDHKGERQPVIPRAMQFHPVSDKPIHVDLYRVEKDAISPSTSSCTSGTTTHRRASSAAACSTSCATPSS